MINIIFFIIMGLTAEEHMDLADRARNDGNCSDVIYHINEAISVGNFTSFTLFVSYWELFVCYKVVNDYDKMAESLFGFVVHSQNLMSMYGDKIWIQDLLKKYDVIEKLKTANIVLFAMWARTNDYSCRSQEFSCPIYYETDLNVYAYIIGCSNKKIKKSGNKYRVKVKCGGNTETYYFRRRNGV